MKTENGYQNPSEFEPVESELKYYDIDFYDGMYFDAGVQRDENNRIQIRSLKLMTPNGYIIHDFDVDYIDELLSPKILTKIYNGYED